MKSYFDFLQQAYFEEHKFSSIFHTVIKCQTTSKEVLNYPTRIIENLVEEKVQCGKYIFKNCEKIHFYFNINSLNEREMQIYHRKRNET